MNPVNVPLNGAGAEAKIRELVAENERLHTALREAHQRIEDTEKKRDDYRMFARLWMQEHHTEADWADFDPNEVGGTMDELIERAEAMLKS